MHETRSLPLPTLHTTIAELVAERPAGITTAEIRTAVAAAPGRPGGGQILRTLGMLLVTGEIDERDGVWVPCGSAHALEADARHAA